MVRRIAQIASVAAALAAIVAGGPAEAGLIRRHIPIKIPAGATSIDFKTTGDIVNGELPVLKARGGTVVPYSAYGLGPPETLNDLRFKDPLAAGMYSLELSSPINIKKIRIWFDYPGIPPNIKGPTDIPEIASLNFDDMGGGGMVAILAENLGGTATATVGPITATIVTGFDSYTSASWLDAVGIDSMIAGGTVAAGADNVDFGSITLGAGQWLRLTAEIDGEVQSFGYSPKVVPEPGGIALALSAAVLCGLVAIRRRRNRA